MTLRPTPRPTRRISIGRRLLGDTRGAAAVEFGLVCLPFFALLGAIIQIAFTIWAAQNFDFVFQKTVRTLFTGQFQQNNDQTVGSAALLMALQQNMCAASTSMIFNCSAVKIDISLGTNFATSIPTYPIDPSTHDWASGFGTHYACAKPGAIVIATGAVKFPVFFGLLDAGLRNFVDGTKLLESTAVFRTEPYVSSSSSPC